MVHPGELLGKDGLGDLEEVGVGRDDAVVGGPARDQVGVVVVVPVVTWGKAAIFKYLNLESIHSLEN